MSDRVRILVVDDSRLVRKALVRNLSEGFDVVEEGDGEAAWQLLILDNTIRAVISDLQMPKLDGAGLLARVRASKQRRLLEMPFIVVSGEETEAERQRVRQLGASDFVTKGAGSAEILTRLNNLLALAAARENLEAGRESMVKDPDTGLYSRTYLEHQATQTLSQARRAGVDLCIMVLGFDAFDKVRERLGPQMAERVGILFARMLAGKVRTEDSLGHFGPGQFAIIAPGTSQLLFTSFAERIRQAVEVAHVPVQGQPVALTVGVGVASIPADTVDSAAHCLNSPASACLRAWPPAATASSAGACRRRSGRSSYRRRWSFSRRSEIVRPHLPQLGLEVLPLLHLLNQELNLNLPMADIESRLHDRTSNKK